MKLLDFLNSILQLIGEPRLSSSNGSLGTITKNAAQNAILVVATTVRPQAFELLVAIEQPIQVLPDSIVQIFSCFLERNSTFTKLNFLPLEQLHNYSGYSIVGSTFYVSKRIEPPFLIRAHALNCPQLPASDDADIGIPSILIPAIQHIAASTLLASYLNDATMSAMHKNMAETLMVQLRGITGIAKGRSFNLGQ